MSDIRLKTITIDPNNSNTLNIQDGIINITNTNISSDILNGTVVIDGGLSINCLQDAISSTSGGAVTIGGGIGIMGQTYLGNNLKLDSNASIISVLGVSDYRLFLDNINNKHFYIAPDGINRRLDLYDTVININLTKQSINASVGSLVINGGISINCTYNSVNSSDGGALTVGGGLAIGGDSYLSKSLTIGQLNSNNNGLLVRYTGYSQIALQNSSGSNTTTFNMNNDTLVISNNANTIFNTSIGNFTFSNTEDTLLTIMQNYSVFEKYVLIIDTIESLNLSTGSLVITGGITVNCTTDSISFESGGGVTIGGGLGISKKTYTNDSIGIELSNSDKNNKLMLYQSNLDLTQTNLFTGIGVTQGSMRLQIPGISNDYIFYSSNTNGISSNEVFRIKGTNEVQFIGNLQRYSVLAGGNSNYDLSFQSQNIATDSSICYFTYDGDTNDNNDIKVFGLGTPNSISDSEYLKIGWNKSNYIISTNYTGIGNNRQLVFQTGINNNQLTLVTDGSLYINSTNVSTCSTFGALVLTAGGLSINGTNDAISLTQGGSLTLNGGLSVMKSGYIGNTLNIYTTIGNIKLYGETAGNCIITNPSDIYTFGGNNTNTTYNLSLNMFSLNNHQISHYELISIYITNTNGNGIYNINSNAGGSGILRPIQLNVGNNTDIYMDTIGNIGINTTNPMYQLDVNGEIQANNYNYFNSLTIYNTNDATSIYTSGSLTVAGGASIQQSLYVGGNVYFTNTMDSSSTSAALYVSGGLTVASGEAGGGGFGALTVNGGGYFGGSVWFQQDINVSGNINGAAGSSNSFAYITVTATDEAINLSTGSLITFGGITVQCNTNSSSVSNGGSILTGGGLSVGQDLYVGGNIYNYGINYINTNFNNSNSCFVQIYDILNFKCFTIDRSISTADFSVSRYNNSGSFIEKSINISRNTGVISLNNTYESLNFSSGTLLVAGGITVQCTTDSTTLSSGGALTVFGGASINKDLYVGGNVVFSSTTVSNDYNEGAIIIDGGVGITGNLNILGNTILTGNLTVNGTTSSIHTTNTLVSDNIIILNAGPSGTADSGFMTQRYQIDNDSGLGDVVNDPNNFIVTLPNQSGMSSTQIKLPMSFSSTDNYYINWWIKIITGFSGNQVRKITNYIGATRVATIDTIFTNQNPTLGDIVNLYDRPYVGIVWSEVNDRFEFGTTVQNPGETSVVFTEHVPIYADSATFNSTISSTCSTYGTLVVTGGVSISSTLDAISLTTGSSLTIAGGASIAKTLYVGNSIYVNGIDIQPNAYDLPTTTIYNGINNVSNANITQLNFPNSVWSFDIFMAIQLVASTNLYSNYNIRGINQGTTWEIIQTYVGDPIVDFNITNGGQLQYTCMNYSSFVSLTFKFKVITN